jgi:hypothetical protein
MIPERIFFVSRGITVELSNLKLRYAGHMEGLLACVYITEISNYVKHIIKTHTHKCRIPVTETDTKCNP